MIDDNGVQRTATSPNEHGNTLGNQPAELYCLNCIETGEPKKYGKTTHGEDRYGAGNQKRYSTDEIEEMGVEYEKIDSGTKSDMHSQQTEMIKQYEKENGKKPELNKTYQ